MQLVSISEPLSPSGPTARLSSSTLEDLTALTTTAHRWRSIHSCWTSTGPARPVLVYTTRVCDGQIGSCGGNWHFACTTWVFVLQSVEQKLSNEIRIQFYTVCFLIKSVSSQFSKAIAHPGTQQSVLESPDRWSSNCTSSVSVIRAPRRAKAARPRHLSRKGRGTPRRGQ